MEKPKTNKNQKLPSVESYLESVYHRYMLNDYNVLENGKLKKDGLETAAKELGITQEEIAARSEDAAKRWDETFRFFASYRRFLTCQTLHFRKDEREERLLKALFGKHVSYENPLNKEVYDRMVEKLRALESNYPGTFHPNAEILDFEFTTKTFFAFPEIGALIGGFYDLVTRFKYLFFAAWERDLEEAEVRQYDFLATVLKVADLYVPHTIYYDTLKRLIPVYREEGFKGERAEFFDLVKLRFCYRFDPWECKDFAEDYDLAQFYASMDPSASRKMIDYGRAVKYYHCLFRWSDECNGTNQPNPDEMDDDGMDAMTDTCLEENLDDDLEKDYAGLNSLERKGFGMIAGWQNVNVPKTEEELQRDGIYAEKLIRLGGDPSVGGVRTPDKGYVLCGYEGHMRSAAHARCYHD